MNESILFLIVLIAVLIPCLVSYLLARFIPKLRYLPSALLLIAGVCFLVTALGTKPTGGGISGFGDLHIFVEMVLGVVSILASGATFFLIRLIPAADDRQSRLEQDDAGRDVFSPSPMVRPKPVSARLAREHEQNLKRAEAAVESAQATYGAGHPAVAQALCDLAQLHQHHSDFGQAEQALTQALAIREQYPSDKAELVETLRSLARLHDVAGESDKSKPLSRRAARIEQEAFRTDFRPVESAEPEYDAHADFVEEMAGSAPKTFWAEVLGGLILPAVLGLHGLRIMLSARVVFHGMHGSMAMDPLIVTGPAAVIFGAAWVCFAAFPHFHFFWPYRHRTLCSYGKAVSLITGAVLLLASMTVLWKG